MKSVIDVLKLNLLACGAVMGAGFLSGRELVGFFGTGNFWAYLIFSGIIFFMGFSIVFISGSKSTHNIEGQRKVFYIATLFSQFVLIVAMTATLNEFGYYLTGEIPILATCCLMFSYFYSEKGMKGVERINCILMPIAILLVNLLIIVSKGKGGMCENIALIPKMPIGKGCLFACMNIFISAPILIQSVKGKKKLPLIISAFLFSLILVLQGGLILLKIKQNNNAGFANVPLLEVVINSNMLPLLFVALFLGAFTSMYSCYLPLSNLCDRKFGKLGKIAFTVTVFCFSLLGMDVIIDYAYPLIGAFGVCYLINLLYMIFKDKFKMVKTFRIKIGKKADNKFVPIKKKRRT